MNHREGSAHTRTLARSLALLRPFGRFKKRSAPSLYVAARRWRCHLPLFLAHPRTLAVVSMEMCVQNLYPRNSPRAAGNSRKALVELRATKEAPREPFPASPPPTPCLLPVRRPSNPSAPARLVRPCIPVCRWETGKRISSRKRPAARSNGYVRVPVAAACVLARPPDDGGAPPCSDTRDISYFTLIPRNFIARPKRG